MRLIFIRYGNGVIIPILELSRQKIDKYRLVIRHKLFGKDTYVSFNMYYIRKFNKNVNIKKLNSNFINSLKWHLDYQTFKDILLEFRTNWFEKTLKLRLLFPKNNCSNYIKEAIERFLDQNFKDFEFIILNY